MWVVEDHSWTKLAGQVLHASPADLLLRRSVFGWSAPVDQQVEVVTAEDEEALAKDVEEVCAQILDLHERALLSVDRIRFAGPPDDFPAGSIEDGD